MGEYISKDNLRDALGKCKCLNDVWDFFFQDQFEKALSSSEIYKLMHDKSHTVYSRENIPYEVVTVIDIKEALNGTNKRR